MKFIRTLVVSTLLLIVSVSSVLPAQAVELFIPESHLESTNLLSGEAVESTLPPSAGQKIDVETSTYSKDTSSNWHGSSIGDSEALAQNLSWWQKLKNKVIEVGHRPVTNKYGLGFMNFAQKINKYTLDGIFGKNVDGITNAIHNRNWISGLKHTGIIIGKTAALAGAAIGIGALAGKAWLIIRVAWPALKSGTLLKVVSKQFTSAIKWFKAAVPAIPKFLSKAWKVIDKASLSITRVFNRISNSITKATKAIEALIATGKKVWKVLDKIPGFRKGVTAIVLTLMSALGVTGAALISNYINPAPATVVVQDASDAKAKDSPTKTGGGKTASGNSGATGTQKTTTAKPASEQITSGGPSAKTTTVSTSVGGGSTTNNSDTVKKDTDSTRTPVATVSNKNDSGTGTTSAPKQTAATSASTTTAKQPAAEKAATASAAKTTATKAVEADSSWLKKTITTLAGKAAAVPKTIVQFAREDLPNILSGKAFAPENATPAQRTLSAAATIAWAVFGLLFTVNVALWYYRRNRMNKSVAAGVPIKEEIA